MMSEIEPDPSVSSVYSDPSVAVEEVSSGSSDQQSTVSSDPSVSPVAVEEGSLPPEFELFDLKQEFPLSILTSEQVNEIIKNASENNLGSLLRYLLSIYDNDNNYGPLLEKFNDLLDGNLFQHLNQSLWNVVTYKELLEEIDCVEIGDCKSFDPHENEASLKKFCSYIVKKQQEKIELQTKQQSKQQTQKQIKQLLKQANNFCKQDIMLFVSAYYYIYELHNIISKLIENIRIFQEQRSKIQRIRENIVIVVIVRNDLLEFIECLNKCIICINNIRYFSRFILLFKPPGSEAVSYEAVSSESAAVAQQSTFESLPLLSNLGQFLFTDILFTEFLKFSDFEFVRKFNNDFCSVDDFFSYAIENSNKMIMKNGKFKSETTPKSKKETFKKISKKLSELTEGLLKNLDDFGPDYFYFPCVTQLRNIAPHNNHYNNIVTIYYSNSQKRHEIIICEIIKFLRNIFIQFFLCSKTEILFPLSLNTENLSLPERGYKYERHDNFPRVHCDSNPTWVATFTDNSDQHPYSKLKMVPTEWGVLTSIGTELVHDFKEKRLGCVSEKVNGNDLNLEIQNLIKLLYFSFGIDYYKHMTHMTEELAAKYFTETSKFAFQDSNTIANTINVINILENGENYRFNIPGIPIGTRLAIPQEVINSNDAGSCPLAGVPSEKEKSDIDHAYGYYGEKFIRLPLEEKDEKDKIVAKREPKMEEDEKKIEESRCNNKNCNEGNCIEEETYLPVVSNALETDALETDKDGSGVMIINGFMVGGAKKENPFTENQTKLSLQEKEWSIKLGNILEIKKTKINENNDLYFSVEVWAQQIDSIQIPSFRNIYKKLSLTSVYDFHTKYLRFLYEQLVNHDLIVNPNHGNGNKFYLDSIYNFCIQKNAILLANMASFPILIKQICDTTYLFNIICEISNCTNEQLKRFIFQVLTGDYGGVSFQKIQIIIENPELRLKYEQSNIHSLVHIYGGDLQFPLSLKSKLIFSIAAYIEGSAVDNNNEFLKYIFNEWKKMDKRFYKGNEGKDLSSQLQHLFLVNENDFLKNMFDEFNRELNRLHSDFSVSLNSSDNIFNEKEKNRRIFKLLCETQEKLLDFHTNTKSKKMLNERMKEKMKKMEEMVNTKEEEGQIKKTKEEMENRRNDMENRRNDMEELKDQMKKIWKKWKRKETI